MIYFSLLDTLPYVLVFSWNPENSALTANRIEKRTITGQGENKTVIRTIKNQTTKLTNVTSIIVYPNTGVTTIISDISTVPITGQAFQTDTEFFFSNREVRLVLNRYSFWSYGGFCARDIICNGLE